MKPILGVRGLGLLAALLILTWAGTAQAQTLAKLVLDGDSVRNLVTVSAPDGTKAIVEAEVKYAEAAGTAEIVVRGNGVRLVRVTTALVHLSDLQEAATRSVPDLLEWARGGRPAEYFSNQSLVGDAAVLTALAPAIERLWAGVVSVAFGGPGQTNLELTFIVAGSQGGAHISGAAKLLFGPADPNGERALISGSFVAGLGGATTLIDEGGVTASSSGWSTVFFGATTLLDAPYSGRFVESKGRLLGSGVRWDNTAAQFTMDGHARIVSPPAR